MKPVSRVAAIMATAMYFVPVYSPTATADSGIAIPTGWTYNVTGANGVCYSIYNPSGNYMFVADQTSNEWSNFYTYPNSATLSACVVAGGG